MAEYSKQFCEMYAKDIPYTFDIMEEANKLDNDTAVNISCEGYGFIAIGKDAIGNILLAMKTDEEIAPWKPYLEVVNNIKKLMENPIVLNYYVPALKK
jgi:hypothetical protein